MSVPREPSSLRFSVSCRSPGSSGGAFARPVGPGSSCSALPTSPLTTRSTTVVLPTPAASEGRRSASSRMRSMRRDLGWDPVDLESQARTGMTVPSGRSLRGRNPPVRRADRVCRPGSWDASRYLPSTGQRRRRVRLRSPPLPHRALGWHGPASSSLLRASREGTPCERSGASEASAAGQSAASEGGEPVVTCFTSSSAAANTRPATPVNCFAMSTVTSVPKPYLPISAQGVSR